jgi:PDZ domain-containing protein
MHAGGLSTTEDSESASASKGLSKIRPSKRWIISRIAGLCILGLIILVLRQPTAYVELLPGKAIVLTGQVHGDVTNHPSATGHGQFAFLAVGVLRQDLFTHFLYQVIPPARSEVIYDPDHQLIAASSPVTQLFVENPVSDMVQSQNTAAAVAYSLTHNKVVRGAGALVEAVNAGSAAQSAGLQTGDAITQVNGENVSDPSDFHNHIVAALGAKQGILLTVLRGGVPSTHPDHVRIDPSLTHDNLIGIYSMQWLANPASLSVSAPGVEGPSGGLLMTLAFLDSLNKGSLAGGKSVTGTGTISPDWTIGQVGGIREKVATALSAGYTVFFVPKAEAKVALSVPHRGMNVVPVVTLNQAVSWLCKHGGTSAVCTNPWIIKPAAVGIG